MHKVAGMNSGGKKRVVVIGMGFGGVRVAEDLAGNGLEVLCLDRRNYHLFQPLLYQVATATLNHEAIAHPIRAIFRGKKDVRFQMAEVQKIDLDNKKVITNDGEVAYDYVVVAAGSVTNHFGMKDVQEYAYDLKQLNDAVALRNHVLAIFERASQEKDPEVREALLTFAVVGAGPTGVEYSGSLIELIQVMSKDFPTIKPSDCKVIMIEAMGAVLPPFPKPLQEYAEKKLRELGVDVRLNTAVKGVIKADAENGRKTDAVKLGDGSELPMFTLFWAAGVKAAPIADALDVPKQRGGRIPVDEHWAIPGHPDAFVIGDMAWYEENGKPLPGVAPVAVQSGQHVAKYIVAKEKKQALPKFKYFDKGSMAIIARRVAVARTGNIKMTGVMAWFAWLAVHVALLEGFRNRVVTIINWVWDYMLMDRQLRLITKEATAAKKETYAIAENGAPAQQNVTTQAPVQTSINSIAS
jgi:NADH dehydrogenase